MFLRSNTTTIQPDRVDEVAPWVEQRLMPVLQEIPGHVGVTAAHARETNELTISTVWADRAALEASAARVAPLREEFATSFASRAIDLVVYEGVAGFRVEPTRPGYLARMREVDVDPSRIDDAATSWRDRMVPLLKGLDGFVSGVMCADRDAGRVAVVTTWRDEAALQAGSGSIDELRMRLMAEVGAQPRREADAVWLVNTSVSLD